MQKEVAELNQNTGEAATEKLGSGIYVDVENIQGIKETQDFIKSLLKTWPKTAPDPTHLNVYVKADQALLWDMWAESQFPHLIVAAKGIQHFSNNQAKNSADIAMAIDAISDILLGRISYVAVVSDDSDFISLYAKLRDEQGRIGYAPGKVPFLWVLTDRSKTRSSTIKDYFPNEHIHVVSFSSRASPVSEKIEANISKEAPTAKKNVGSLLEDMAQAIIKEIPLGKFKSTDCQKIIKSHWPDHKLAKSSGQNFGVEFRKDLWPILEKRGVSEPNSNKQPRRYEMTQAAKDSVR